MSAETFEERVSRVERALRGAAEGGERGGFVHVEDSEYHSALYRARRDGSYPRMLKVLGCRLAARPPTVRACEVVLCVGRPRRGGATTRQKRLGWRIRVREGGVTVGPLARYNARTARPRS
jgi:hypothetical protein